jgi:hypothetical protein
MLKGGTVLMINPHDISHLTPDAAAWAMRPDEERIRAIWDSPWVDYPRASFLLSVLNDVVERPRATRMPSVAIYADSGMGKTMLMNQFLKRHKTRFDRPAMADLTPVLSLQMTAKPNEKRFYTQLLDLVGAPPNPRMGLADIEVLALRILRHVKARMLLIDEAHNMLAATYTEQRAMLNLIRFLSNELQISVVCLGVTDAREAISGDVQLARRFREYTLPRWQADEDYQNLVINVLRNLPLKRPSQLSARALKALLSQCDGITAHIIGQLQEAAILAVRSARECIDDSLLTQLEPPQISAVRYA